MNLLERRGVAYARVYYSAWIADCPNPHCDNALALQRGQAWFVCDLPRGGCGEVSEIAWPARPDDIERILLMRPAPRNRNWNPNESVQDLYQENIDHGILPVPPELVAAHQGLVFEVSDDRILIDRAPLPTIRRRQIEG